MSDKELGTLIIFWDGYETECFAITESLKLKEQAKYWIRRRYERRGSMPSRCFYAEGEFDTSDIQAEIYADESRYQKEIQDMQDKKDYERLRKKYEGQQ